MAGDLRQMTRAASSTAYMNVSMSFQSHVKSHVSSCPVNRDSIDFETIIYSVPFGSNGDPRDFANYSTSSTNSLLKYNSHISDSFLEKPITKISESTATRSGVNELADTDCIKWQMVFQ